MRRKDTQQWREGNNAENRIVKFFSHIYIRKNYSQNENSFFVFFFILTVRIFRLGNP